MHKIIEIIKGLKTISADEKALLLSEAKAIEKENKRLDFKIKRIEKDKTIAINILNETIKDLEKNKLITEQANQKLSDQKKALKKQKKIIEKNAFLLEENLKQLELSFKELEQFSYIVSHDLKSPLRTISSFAQLLKKRYYKQLDKEADEFIDFIVSGIFQMDKVIHSLLEYSMIGNANNFFSHTDLNEVIEIVQQNLKKEIKESKTSIEYQELPIIYGNKTGFVQLFQNLISNAIKFKSIANPVIQISCTPQENKWQFRLEDNGIGISEEFQEKVFFPFQRLNKQGIPGTGIGLAICKKIVKMHHGEIYFEPNSLGGTTFVFSLADQKVLVEEESAV